MRTILWERHCCLPLTVEADVEELLRYRRPGGAFVSANVGYSPHSWDDVTALLDAYTRAIDASTWLGPARSVADVERIAAMGGVAVAFDLEDSGPLGGDPTRVAELYRRGVRSMLLAYNHGNAAAGGCLDQQDAGLTTYGRDLVRAMNDVGMQVDASHCGVRSSLEMSELTRTPLIYTHSCMRGVWDHPRNITDDQARACADTGGVIGITGVGVFLGQNDASLNAMCRHIEYALDLVGPDHVGVSTDFNFDYADLLRQLEEHPELFPDDFTRWGPVDFISPELLCRVGDALAARGFDQATVAKVVGLNFQRVAEQTWQ